MKINNKENTHKKQGEHTMTTTRRTHNDNNKENTQ